MKTPLRYAGGKSKALKKISEYLPNVNRIVSPFIGGGSLECYWASSIPVVGADYFKPLTNFWNVLLTDNKGLANKLSKLTPDKQTYNEIKELLLCCRDDDSTNTTRGTRHQVVLPLCSVSHPRHARVRGALTSMAIDGCNEGGEFWQWQSNLIRQRLIQQRVGRYDAHAHDGAGGSRVPSAGVGCMHGVR